MKSLFLAAAATLALSAPAFAQKASSPDDFVKDAIQADNAEIQMGKLAAARGGTKEVRDFGKTLEKDHQKGGMEARKLARELKIKPPTGIPDEARQEHAKLMKLKGKDFDQEFASYMVDDHKKDIQKFQDEASNASDQKVKDFANSQLPALQKHLEMAQKLAGAQTGSR
jgi:putative membrane protein